MRDAAVRLGGVRKKYAHFCLEGIDLDVSAGRTLGLIGQNGAGKSTLLRIIMGLVQADGGRVEVLGRPMPADERVVKTRIGFVSEDMALYGGATLRWHMAFVRPFYGSWDDTPAAALLDRLDLNPEQKVRGMSRRQQVKAMLLFALAHRPALLVLDEPTAGLDPLVRTEVLALLRAAREEGRTILFSSHRGDDVSGLADDVVFVHEGRLLAQGPASGFPGGGGDLERIFLDLVRAAGEGRAA
jgi:ABC-2 type transport system ATP-binding protein